MHIRVIVKSEWSLDCSSVFIRCCILFFVEWIFQQSSRIFFSCQSVWKYDETQILILNFNAELLRTFPERVICTYEWMEYIGTATSCINSTAVRCSVCIPGMLYHRYVPGTVVTVTCHCCCYAATAAAAARCCWCSILVLLYIMPNCYLHFRTVICMYDWIEYIWTATSCSTVCIYTRYAVPQVSRHR